MEGRHFPSLEGLLQSLSPFQAPSSVHSCSFLSWAEDWAQSSARQSGLSPHPRRVQLSWGTLRTQARAHPRVLTQVRVLIPLRALPLPPHPQSLVSLERAVRGRPRGASGRETWQGPQVAVSGRFPAQFLPRRLVPDGGREGRRGGPVGEGRQLDTEGLLVALHERGWEVGSCSAPPPGWGARAGGGVQCCSQQRDRPPPAPSPAPLPSLSLPWTVCLRSGGPGRGLL